MLVIVISEGMVSSGLATANNKKVIVSGGTAIEIGVCGGYFPEGGTFILKGGEAIRTVVSGPFNPSVFCISRGVAKNTGIQPSAYVYVFSGGTAYDTTATGYVFLSGGMASGTILHGTTTKGFGHLNVFSGGMASDTTIETGAMMILSGGAANPDGCFRRKRHGDAEYHEFRRVRRGYIRHGGVRRSGLAGDIRGSRGRHFRQFVSSKTPGDPNP